ncbi:MAG: CSLREA domain-containing protein, partial [Chloroflexi bacterium]|nr:CSLREA domain-containing protein [Chloroflexota bacterium]
LTLFASLSLVFFWLFATPARVQAKTITVTTTADNVNALDGQCSLREAIIAANTNAIGGITGECPPGDDTIADVIVLADGATYTLSLPGTGEDASATGDLDILDDLPQIDIQIIVENDGIAIIDANAIDRVLHVHGARVEMTGVTFQNGFEPTIGGNILNDTGTLTLTDCNVKWGDSGAGGGIYNINGLVTLTDTAVQLNVAEIVGGGLFSLGDAAVLTLDDGAVQSNVTNSGSGGGLSANGGQVILRNTTLIFANQANANGGGVSLSGTATIRMTNTWITHNTADNGLGGGLFLGGADNLTDFYLHDSVFNDNTAVGNGGAIAIVPEDVVYIENTDFSDNYSFADGGALSGSRFAILGGTFEGNEAAGNGGAIASTKVSLIGADFTGNVSGIDGGAIYGTIVTVSGGLFEDNHADTGMGGAIGNSTS